MIKPTRRSLMRASSAIAAAALVSPRALEAKMIEPTSPTEQMMYTTARIVGVDAQNKPFKTGTGFFYQFPVAPGDDRNLPLLITNKHVVEGVVYADFRLHTNSNGGAEPDGNINVRSQSVSGFHIRTRKLICAHWPLEVL
jgi:hypothetical protein